MFIDNLQLFKLQIVFDLFRILEFTRSTEKMEWGIIILMCLTRSSEKS